VGAGIIPTVPSRRQIEETVEALHQEHEGGRAFADAVEAYARSLDEDEREVLGEVLLQRADEEGAFQRGIALRLDSRGWFRRQLDKLEPPGGRTP
jgi:hypothetical protein